MWGFLRQFCCQAVDVLRLPPLGAAGLKRLLLTPPRIILIPAKTITIASASPKRGLRAQAKRLTARVRMFGSMSTATSPSATEVNTSAARSTNEVPNPLFHSITSLPESNTDQSSVGLVLCATPGMNYSECHYFRANRKVKKLTLQINQRKLVTMIKHGLNCFQGLSVGRDFIKVLRPFFAGAQERETSAFQLLTVYIVNLQVLVKFRRYYITF